MRGDEPPGYRPRRDAIYLSIAPGNLDEPEREDRPSAEDDWPHWQRELVHETLHEYEHKIITESPDVRDSCRRHDAAGHGWLFHLDRLSVVSGSSDG